MAGYGQPSYSYQLAPMYAGYGLQSTQTAIPGTEVNTAIANPTYGFAGTGYAAQQQQQFYGASNDAMIGFGYGQRIPAAKDIQAQYVGKPSFFDASRGILWDAKTQTAYYYAPTGLSIVGAGASPTRSVSSANLVTAIETTPTGTRVTLGNGTTGNLSDHRNAISSVYYIDSPCQ